MLDMVGRGLETFDHTSKYSVQFNAKTKESDLAGCNSQPRQAADPSSRLFPSIIISKGLSTAEGRERACISAYASIESEMLVVNPQCLGSGDSPGSAEPKITTSSD